MYTHTFLIDAEHVTEVDSFQGSVFTLQFEMTDEDHGPQDVDLVAIDDRAPLSTEIKELENGGRDFWATVGEACLDEMSNLLARWAEDAALAKAERQNETDSRIADMGMNVPAR